MILESGICMSQLFRSLLTRSEPSFATESFFKSWAAQSAILADT